MLAFVIVTAIAALGWTLVSAIDRDDPTDSDDPGDGDPLVGAIRSSTAFDPEGTGAPGEHNDRAAFAIDGDMATTWTTERYRGRDLGAKSGVGLVLTLDRVRDLRQITIHTDDAEDWAVEIRVTTGVAADAATGIADFGDIAGRGSGLGTVASIPLSAEGDTVVVWLTDLGVGNQPSSLAIREVTVR